jgi:modulator of FtsH protease HflK
VTINAVYPPILVKSYFLDVTSARADKINSINEGLAYAESRGAAAQAEARRTLDEAASYRRQTVESAQAQAESFSRLIEQFRREAQSGGRTYEQARKTALTRRYYETMRDVLKSVSTKVLLDSGEPADLTIFTAPGDARPAPPPQRRAAPNEPENSPPWLR